MDINLQLEDRKGTPRFREVLSLIPFKRRVKTKYITPNGIEVSRKRFLLMDKKKREEKYFLENNLFEKLGDSEIDIDLEKIGKPIDKTYEVPINWDYDLQYNYMRMVKRTLPNGEIQIKNYELKESNVNREDLPLIVSLNKLISKEKIISDYVITKSYFIQHQERGQFEEIYDFAEYLHKQKKMAKVFAFEEKGSKKVTPIYLVRNGKGYFYSFIEGRINENGYLLIFHLSDLPFKIPDQFKRVENK